MSKPTRFDMGAPASQRPVLLARLKPLDDSGRRWRVLCSRCDGDLGLLSPPPTSDERASHAQVAELLPHPPELRARLGGQNAPAPTMPLESWTVRHAHRFRRDHDGIFHVIRGRRRDASGRPLGRRRFADRIIRREEPEVGAAFERYMHMLRIEGGSAPRHPIGDPVLLPAVVKCPSAKCGTLNRIDAPPEP